MNTMFCRRCRDRGRVSKPAMVPYIERRTEARKYVWACQFCDSTELWPVFTRSEPKIPRE